MMINSTTHKRESHTMISSDKEYLGHVIATYSPFLVRSALTRKVLIGFSFMNTDNTSIIVHFTTQSIIKLLPALHLLLQKATPSTEQQEYLRILCQPRITPDEETRLRDRPITYSRGIKPPLPDNAMDTDTSTIAMITHLKIYDDILQFDFTFADRHFHRFTMPLWMASHFGEDADRLLRAAESRRA